MSADEITRLLDELGRRLGPTGEYVFGLAVRQVYINALGWSALAVVLLGFGVWAWRRAPRADDVDAPIVRLVGGVLIGVAAFGLIYSLTLILNPEYQAISNLLEAAR